MCIMRIKIISSDTLSMWTFRSVCRVLGAQRWRNWEMLFRVPKQNKLEYYCVSMLIFFNSSKLNKKLNYYT